ncbi:hypothetical protein LNKW23_07650 [Paralimibaculum aggregatum]|uniref:Uncharacterized protein n=2 Tax=Paralimibaculum aggregatum TaxID=3036245 RepID=A0ABQ6LEZ1_9RHOB|nr:hypothetical protein LNKW23_07650 [Limibaculum sp. NKW23]
MARAAGWRGADLAFERLTEAGCAALHGGDLPAAIAAFGKARRLAFWRIARSDPRHATSLANAAMAARLAGREARARRLYAAARRRWAAVPGRVAAVEPARRARSSLFHLRMEARHWDTYVANQRKRLAGFVADADAALAALAESRRPPARLYTRWRGEKPPVFDEMRKLMSAALLIAAPPEDRPEDRLEA